MSSLDDDDGMDAMRHSIELWDHQDGICDKRKCSYCDQKSKKTKKEKDYER